VNNLFAWLLFGVALAWSFLVGLLAGVGAAVVARRSTDALNIVVAVLFMFGVPSCCPRSWCLAVI